MQEIWQKNRQVLIKALSALAIFLVLSNIARGYRSDYENKLVRNEEEAQVLAQKLEELDGVVDVERKSRTALEERNQDLLKKMGISYSASHQAPTEGGTFSIDFKRAKDSVWIDFRDRANRIGLVTPSDIPNFDERGDLSDVEWVDRYRLLEVMDRFLKACLQTDIVRIDKVVPGDRVQEDLHDEKKVLVRYPVVFELICKPQQLSEMIIRFQRDQSFLSIEPGTVSRDKDDQERISVSLTVVGIDMEDPRDDSSDNRRSSRQPRRGF